MKTELIYKSDMHFECKTRNIITHIDSGPNHGGHDLGPTPKELLLQGVAGCSGMDVVSILVKMRFKIKKFEIEVDANQTEEYPTHFKTIAVIYKLEGDIPAEKVIHAVTLSMTKYCGVSYMLSRSAPIKYIVNLNGLNIHQGEAKF